MRGVSPAAQIERCKPAKRRLDSALGVSPAVPYGDVGQMARDEGDRGEGGEGEDYAGCGSPRRPGCWRARGRDVGHDSKTIGTTESVTSWAWERGKRETGSGRQEGRLAASTAASPSAMTLLSETPDREVFHGTPLSQPRTYSTRRRRRDPKSELHRAGEVAAAQRRRVLQASPSARDGLLGTTKPHLPNQQRLETRHRAERIQPRIAMQVELEV